MSWASAHSRVSAHAGQKFELHVHLAPVGTYIKHYSTITASHPVQPTPVKVDVGKKKKESKDFLGGLTPHNIIDQEDSDIQSTVVWRDPFRMSVLDFQRSALDKVAEVLKIFIKYATEKGPLKGEPLQREGFKSFKTSMKENMEDLHFQLHHIKYKKEVYAKLLASPTEVINEKCNMLITARNHTAHQAYVKDDITPPHNPSKPSKNRLGAGHVPLRETKTFGHTKDVVVTCLEFAEKVLEGMEEAKQIVSGSDKRECPVIELHTKDKIN